MRSQLDVFYELTLDLLGSDTLGKRLTKDRLYRDLCDVDTQVFEDVLAATGQESLFGYTEATITLDSDTNFYSWPYGFRKFLSLEYRNDNGVVIDNLGTAPFYRNSRGVMLLSSNRGFKMPYTVTSEQDWTICYLRGPVRMHFAKAASVKAKAVIAGTPGTYAGELLTVPDAYNGSELTIYSAAFGAPQTRVVEKYIVDQTGVCTFILRDALSPVPTGEVWYEINLTLPREHLRLYALDVAIANLPSREEGGKASELISLRRKAWAAAQSFVTANTADRGPARNRPLRRIDMMPVEVPRH
jgi:hypothetical protein